MTVWRKAAYFDPSRASVAAWMFTIARNLRIDSLRREKSAVAYALSVHEPEAGEETPHTMSEIAQAQTRLRQAVAVLPPEQLDVVRLSFFEDKPHAEIAEQLCLAARHGEISSAPGAGQVARAGWRSRMSPKRHPSEAILADYASGALRSAFSRRGRRPPGALRSLPCKRSPSLRRSAAPCWKTRLPAPMADDGLAQRDGGARFHALRRCGRHSAKPTIERVAFGPGTRYGRSSVSRKAKRRQ